jgi:hypothetical protein
MTNMSPPDPNESRPDLPMRAILPALTSFTTRLLRVLGGLLGPN